MVGIENISLTQNLNQRGSFLGWKKGEVNESDGGPGTFRFFHQRGKKTHAPECKANSLKFSKIRLFL